MVLYSKTQRDKERVIKTSVVKVKERKQNRTKQNNSLACAARILFTAHSIGDSRRCRFAVVVWFASVACISQHDWATVANVGAVLKLNLVGNKFVALSNAVGPNLCPSRRAKGNLD